ncbi:MAG: translocation/assembly module TamB domain-containing protein [Burkholderiales bacterium]|nr:translocation/assembly module TamB domain-containing protein [Burkholderiales bacterium]
MIDNAPPPSALPRRRFRLGPFWLELVLFGVVLLVGGFVLLASSTAGTRGIVAIAQKLSAGTLKVGRVDGTLWGRLGLYDIHMDTSTTHIVLDRLALDWQASRLLHGEVLVERLELGALNIHTVQSDKRPVLPASLALPVSLTVRDARLGSLWLNDRLWAQGIAATATSDGHRHHVTLLRAVTPWFDAKGEASLQGDAPFRLGGNLELDGASEDASWQLNTALSGGLADMRLTGAGVGGPNGIPPFRADFDVHLDPFATTRYAILKAARVEMRGVDLHVLSPRLPQTVLNASVMARPEGPTVATQVHVDNTIAGNWQAARLPLTRLDAAIRLNTEGAHIESLDARMAAGSIQVAGTLGLQQLGLVAQLDKLQLQQVGGPDLPLSGRIQLDGARANPHLEAELMAKAVSLDLDGRLVGQAGNRLIDAQRLVLASGGGELDVKGRLALDGNRGFNVDGMMSHFNPEHLSAVASRPIPNGDLNGKIQLTGTLNPLAVRTDWKIANSRINGRGLSGQVVASWRPGRLESTNVDLTLGANHLVAKGGFGTSDDSLRIDALMPSLAEIGTGFAGRVDAKLTLAGNLHRPSLDGSLHADGLRTPGNVAVAHASLSASLDASPSRPQDSPLALKLDVTGLTASRLTLDSARLTLNGTQLGHVADLQAQGKVADQDLNLSVRADGALDSHGWHGHVEHLENQGDWPLKVDSPAKLAISRNGMAVDSLDAAILGAHVHLAHLDWQGAQFSAVGNIDNMAMADWVSRLPDVKRRIWTDLVMSARFDLHGDQRLAGNLTLERQAGDVLLLTDDPTVKPIPLKLAAAQATLDLNGVNAIIGLNLKSDEFGTAVGRLATQFERTEKGWRPANGAVLDGDIKAQMPSLGWVAPLLGPTAGVEGKLTAELKAGGVVGAPQWYGQVNLDGFALRLPEFGANWHDGTLAATLQGDTAELAALSLRAGKGDVTAQGRMSLLGGGPEGDLTVKFNHFAAIARPDRNLTASGETTLAMQGNALTLTGNLKADEGSVELVKSNVAELSEDVTVRGRADKPKLQGKAPPLTLRLDLDLGDHFHFKGQGVDAQLSGSVRVTASPTQRLAATGAVRAEEGRYTAYGQNLTISRGVLIYQGPFDNPSLDILAERKNLPVQVGVKITGTAQAPRVTLTSDQSMPDSEKLSWLVLGHGSSTASAKGDADVLMAAAEALFSGGQSSGIREQVASRLGLDDISVGRGSGTTYGGSVAGSDALPAGTVVNAATNSAAAASAAAAANTPLSGRVVSLGKRLSDKIYISYEQSIDGIGYAVKLTYQLTKKVSVALTAGQTSSVDVLYSWLFN